MHFHVVTLFPESFSSYLKSSILGRAVGDKKISVSFYNPREYAEDPHRRIDDRPYGGGPGMVIEAKPVARAVEAARGRKKSVTTLFLCANGAQFSSTHAERYARTYRHVILIAGHYEGIDARVVDMVGAERLSIGPYILTGGELPALVVVDAVSRFVPGVLGNEQSLEEKRVASHEVYTRPDEIIHKGKRYRVPDILLSGHHQQIDVWRRERGQEGE